MGDNFEINIPEIPEIQINFMQPIKAEEIRTNVSEPICKQKSLVAHITFVPEKRPRWRQIQRAMRMVDTDQHRRFMEKSLRTQGVKVDLIGVCNGKRIELVNIKPELHGGDMAFTIGGEQDG